MRLDYQILLKSPPPLTLLVGSALPDSTVRPELTEICFVTRLKAADCSKIFTFARIIFVPFATTRASKLRHTRVATTHVSKLRHTRVV